MPQVDALGSEARASLLAVHTPTTDGLLLPPDPPVGLAAGVGLGAPTLVEC